VKKALSLIVVVLALFFFNTLSASAKSLIVMGWDGAGLKNVGPMLARGELPNLQSIINNGGYLIPLEVTERTVTIPGWTEIFTGRAPDQTGVYGNKKLPLTITGTTIKNNGTFGFWIKSFPYEWTVPSMLKAGGMKIGWVVSKEFLGSSDQKCPFSGIAKNADMYLLSAPKKGTVDYLANFRARVYKFLANRAQNDFFLFVHTDPDEFGHMDGEDSGRYLEELRNSDALLGDVLQRINRSKVSIMVTADHGFDKGLKTHVNAPDSWLVTDLPIVLPYGNIRDIAPTILNWFNVAVSSEIRGKSLLREVAIPE
jgi:predicted AlkP superfamily pyrophosphatase or phosphodiesterase